MEEKIMRTLEAMEHPESFSKEELHNLLNDPECVAIARDILDSREALARQHAPAPDVNAEWESFKRRNISIETPSPWKRNVKAIRWGAAMLVAASLALLFLFHFSAPTEYVVFEATQVAQVVSMETNNGIHTLKIPRGMNQQLTLTDGTKVWLNAESTLEYPETFEGKPNREVYLKGEAYFEVTKDAEHPFRVKTDALETLVLGTSFNVRAYSKEDTQVTLVEGSVKVSDKHQGELHLQPGEHTNQKLNKTKVEKADDYHSWAEGMFYFDNTELVEIMRELGRWYNINIVFTNKEIMHDRLHFQAERKGTLEDALELLNTMQKVMEVEVQATVMAEGLNDFMDVVDSEMSTQEFVSAKQVYGSQQSAASGSLGVISLILGLLGIGSCALGYHLFVSGGIAGDPTSEQVFIRIGEAFLAATVTINIIAGLFHINL